MKPIINFAILLVMPMAIGFSSIKDTIHHNTAPDGRYCNARFDFCVNFPEALFTKQISSDNDDGIRLTSADGKVRVDVSGAYNVGNWSVVDMYEFALNDIDADHPEKVKHFGHEIGKTYYEATFEYGNELYFSRTVLHHNNTYITLTIAVPADMEGLLDSLKDEVQLDIHS